MPKAVLFDMDGVLIDSFDAHYQSWVDLAGETGKTFTEADFTWGFGRTSRECITKYWGAALGEKETRRLDDRKEVLFRKIIADKPPIMDGAEALIASLKAAGFKLAIGSSGPPENVMLTYDYLGGSDTFDAVVTGMDVTRGKPDPEVFLTCADRVGVEPDRCAVIEDAAAGVAAANAAGMISIGMVSTGRTEQQLAGANIVVHSLRDLTAEQISTLVNAT